MLPTIVYPPTIDWDQLHQRPQQIMKALAKLGSRCIFCNINLHSTRDRGIIPLQENLWLANDTSFRDALAWCRNQFPGNPLVIYYTYPPQIGQIIAIRPDLIVFDSVDEPIGEFCNWQEGYERSLRAADIVTATAHSLIDRAAAYGRVAEYLPNGCDYQHFAAAQTPQPIDIAVLNTARPVIGYTGSIAPWLDYSLINRLARLLPHFDIVLMGSMLLMRGLGFASPNLYYLGPIAYDQLPRYISRFTYCLIPFRITKMTKGVNPVKYWEYLASGIPLLSTSLPEVSPELATILPAELADNWIPPDDQPLARSQRIDTAKANDWSIRASVLYDLLCHSLSQG